MSQGISNLTILAGLEGIVSPEKIFKVEKPVPIFSKTLSLDIIRPYNLLRSEKISKFYQRKAKTTFKTQQWI